MPRPFQTIPVTDLKGLNTSQHPHSIKQNEFSLLSNLNPENGGYLEKRRGLSRVTDTVPSGYFGSSNGFGLKLILVSSQSTGRWMFVSDNAHLWRAPYPAGAPFTEIGTGLTGINAGVQAYDNVSFVRTTGIPHGVLPDGTYAASASGPTGTTCAVFRSRMWIANALGPKTTGADNAARLNFSSVDNFGIWSSPNGGFIDIQPGDGQVITQVVVYNDSLFIFKDKSIWSMSAEGSPGPSWIARNVHPTIGAIGRSTVRIINGMLYFFSGETVYRSDGTTFEEIGQPLRDFFSSFDYSNPANYYMRTESGFWDNKYILSFYTYPNSAFVYNIDTETWTRWDFTGASVNGWDTVQEGAADTLYTGSTSNGRLYQMYKGAWYKDDAIGSTGGNTYTCSAEGRWEEFDLPAEYKRIHMISVLVKLWSGQTIGLSQYKDRRPTLGVYQPAYDTQAAVNGVAGGIEFYEIHKFKGAGRCRMVKPRFLFSGDGDVKFFGWNYHVEKKDTVVDTH